MNRKYSDIISGIFFMIFSISIYVLSVVTLNQNKEIRYDSSTIPKLISILLFFISLLLVVNGIKNLANYKNVTAKKINISAVLLTFALIGFYTFSMNFLGFILSSIIYITLQIIIFTNYNWTGILKYIAISAVTSLVLYLFFTRCLYLLLPPGLINL